MAPALTVFLSSSPPVRTLALSSTLVLSPSNRVLLVCTELCSLHMQLDGRVDNLVGSALFADGSGAMIVGQAPREGERPLFEMCKTASVIIPETVDMMSWSARVKCRKHSGGQRRRDMPAVSQCPLAQLNDSLALLSVPLPPPFPACLYSLFSSQGSDELWHGDRSGQGDSGRHLPLH